MHESISFDISLLAFSHRMHLLYIELYIYPSRLIFIQVPMYLAWVVFGYLRSL